jgi:hypothetical protein
LQALGSTASEAMPRRTRSAGAEVGKKTLMVFQVVY